MNRKIKKNLFAERKGIVAILCVALMLMGCFSSCSHKEESGSVIGVWKLVEVRGIGNSKESYDYSQYSIVFEFHTNDILTVSGEPEQIYWVPGVEPGEYPFSSLTEDEVKEYHWIPDPKLKIGWNDAWSFPWDVYWYNVSSKELMLHLSGSVIYYYFIKINQ